MTADPTLVNTKRGKASCRFTIANNRYYFQGKNLVDEVSFFKVVVSGPLGERCVEHLKKGSLVLVSGSIKSQQLQSHEGTKSLDIVLTAANVKFLSKNKDAIDDREFVPPVVDGQYAVAQGDCASGADSQAKITKSSESISE